MPICPSGCGPDYKAIQFNKRLDEVRDEIDAVKRDIDLEKMPDPRTIPGGEALKAELDRLVTRARDLSNTFTKLLPPLPTGGGLFLKPAGPPIPNPYDVDLHEDLEEYSRYAQELRRDLEEWRAKLEASKTVEENIRNFKGMLDKARDAVKGAVGRIGRGSPTGGGPGGGAPGLPGGGPDAGLGNLGGSRGGRGPGGSQFLPGLGFFPGAGPGPGGGVGHGIGGFGPGSGDGGLPGMGGGSFKKGSGGTGMQPGSRGGKGGSGPGYGEGSKGSSDRRGGGGEVDREKYGGGGGGGGYQAIDKSQETASGNSVPVAPGGEPPVSGGGGDGGGGGGGGCPSANSLGGGAEDLVHKHGGAPPCGGDEWEGDGGGESAPIKKGGPYFAPHASGVGRVAPGGLPVTVPGQVQSYLDFLHKSVGPSDDGFGGNNPVVRPGDLIKPADDSTGPYNPKGTDYRPAPDDPSPGGPAGAVGRVAVRVRATRG